MSTFERIKEESGFALATALLVMLVCFILGLATIQSVVAETHQSGHEAAGEAAFDLAESVIDAESLQLANNWPGSSSAAYPTNCNQSSSASTGCPGATVTNSFAAKYAGVNYGNPTWSVLVLDDNGTGGSSYYSDSLASANPLVSYDANGDNRMWIRAKATVWGQTKIVVTQVTRQSQSISLPMATIVSGGVTTENNGNKVIINATDPSSGLTGPLDLRCGTATTTASYGSSCAGWDPTHGQLSPASSYQAGYTSPGNGFQAISTADIGELENTAKSEGSYYNGVCPTAAQLNTTNIVFVDGASCSFTTGTYNSSTAPGVVIFSTGTLTFNGNVTYYGIVYMANQNGALPTSGECTSAQQTPMITVHGGAAVYGAIFVDGCGTVDAGEAKFDVNFMSNAFNAFKAYANPAMAQNTFRIIPNS